MTHKEALTIVVFQDAMVPKKAAPPEETHAATLNEVLTIMDLLEKEGENRACAAIALMFLRRTPKSVLAMNFSQ